MIGEDSSEGCGSRIGFDRRKYLNDFLNFKILGRFFLPGRIEDGKVFEKAALVDGSFVDDPFPIHPHAE